LVQTVEDILDELEQLPLGATSDGGGSGSQPEDSKAMQSGPAVILSDVERQVLEVVTTEPSPLARLVERLDLPVRAISAALIGLELKRCIRALPGQSFARIP